MPSAIAASRLRRLHFPQFSQDLYPPKLYRPTDFRLWVPPIFLKRLRTESYQTVMIEVHRPLRYITYIYIIYTPQWYRLTAVLLRRLLLSSFVERFKII